MKKLLMIILTLAMVVSYIPRLEAGETASFGLTVNFDIPNEPLSIWSEPAGPFEVTEREVVEFHVIAEDLDSDSLTLIAPERYMGGPIEVIIGEKPARSLPQGAYWTPVPTMEPTRCEGILTWNTLSFQGGRGLPYVINFLATSTKDGEVQHATLSVEITVNDLVPVISIELTQDMLSFDNVKLGDLITCKPTPSAINTGNWPVLLEMGYGQTGLTPGLEQGLDTFTTSIDGVILPPTGWMLIGNSSGLEPGGETPFIFVYGAPTELSHSPSGTDKDITGMLATYNIRAIPCPPDPEIY